MANYSGLFNGVHNEDYALLSGKSPNRYHLARILRKRGMREFGETLSELVGSASGQSASVTVSKVQANADTTANVQGGKRTIESVELMGAALGDTDINAAGANTARNTTAADVTILNDTILPTGVQSRRDPATYIEDASGNGGGGKLS